MGLQCKFYTSVGTPAVLITFIVPVLLLLGNKLSFHSVLYFSMSSYIYVSVYVANKLLHYLAPATAGDRELFARHKGCSTLKGFRTPHQE